ncbi:hypothetical protein NIES39_C04400 [Arthrospira platensis NIES-39]|nr:hypothetical protein NIES39_C04400 [Arthrospira platensis NIES-39]
MVVRLLWQFFGFLNDIEGVLALKSDIYVRTYSHNNIICQVRRFVNCLKVN